MTPTLDAALLYSSDLGRMSDWLRSFGNKRLTSSQTDLVICMIKNNLKKKFYFATFFVDLFHLYSAVAGSPC